MSKRVGLIAILAMVLILGLATGVFAAQNSDYSGSPTDGINDFAATPKVFGTEAEKQYPNGIYLPNSQNPAQYRIHSNYAATTDACASCHTTHTAVGEALLQFESATNTCLACHDGTVSTTYDVKSGTVGNTHMPSSAGPFGANSQKSGSSHNVIGEALSVYAAPGGPGTAGVEAPSWETEFGCQSCHSPHGMGGNARILNPDVNGYASAAYAKGNYNADASLLTAANSANVTVNGNNIGGSKNVPLYKDADGTYYSNWKNVQTYSGGVFARNTAVKDQWLWSGHPYSKNVAVYVAGTKKTLGTDYTLDNTAGYTKVTFKAGVVSEGAAVTADFMPALVVKMKITDYLQSTEKVEHVAGLNDFCGACHTDYNTSNVSSPHANLNGTYTEAYRHKVGFDRTSKQADLLKLNMKLESGKVTCETCHVAHGTDQDYWFNTLTLSNGPSASFAYDKLTEAAGSSALKRLPNMGTCEACHAKGVASQGYAGNSGSPAIPAQPSNTAFAPGGGYVGQQTCKSCHGNVSEHFAETWHPSMSRPGVTKVTWDSVKGSLVNADGSFNAAYAPTLDAKALPGFAQALYNTMTELAGKNMFDEKGAVITDPAVWKAKSINAAKIQVWTTGTTKQEIAVKGSALGHTGDTADKWYLVTEWGRGVNDFVSFGEEEDYTCGSTALGCHTTGKLFDNNGKPDSADMTAWVNAAVTGTQPFELGITCESCHGQGGNHAKSPAAKNIVNPANFTQVEQTVGLGATKTGNTWSAAGASKFLNADSKALACGKCHSGAKHQGDYYSSGTYSGSTTGKTFTPSKHFTSGVVGCNSCHNTHQESKGLVAYGTSQQTCESCHGKLTNFNLNAYMPALERDAELHEHQFKTGVPIPASQTQIQEGRRLP